MPIMLLIDHPGMNRDHYDSLRPVVNWEGDYPEGILLHSCGFDEQGGLHVVDIWESQAYAESFFANRLGPALQQLGISQPQPSFIEVHNIDVYPGLERHTP